MAIFTVNITIIMIRMVVIVMMSVALASDSCGAQIILLRLLLLLMMTIGTNGALPVFWTDALGKVALNGETLKLLSVCGSEVN